MVLAGVVLLVASYIASWGGWQWLRGHETAGGATVSSMKWVGTAFAPIDVYTRSGMPGSRTLRILSSWCYCHGEGGSETWSYLNENLPP